MRTKRYSNIIGFDDAPFGRDEIAEVTVVGAVYARLRFDGVLIGQIHKDGDDATQTLSSMISRSKFKEHIQLIMLQGIAMAGFNVVDVIGLHQNVGLPVMVVVRKQPDMEAIREALVTRIPNGQKKWSQIKRLGPMERVGNIFIQRAGLSLGQAAKMIDDFAVYSHIPEPIRTAHLIAGAIVDGESRGNP